jgi:hypothetical protein
VSCRPSIGLVCAASCAAGVTRPDRLVRMAAGLTTKVLNERLAKPVRYGVLDAIASLQDDVDRGAVL